MHIEAAKVKTIKNAAIGPDAVTEDLETDIKLATAWVDFKKRMAAFCENVNTIAVELQFESSYDEKTHHQFGADEAVFIGDIKISPKNQVVFTVPFGAKEKSFHFSDAEVINVIANEGDAPEQLNTVISRLFRESFSEFKDIATVTMLERKYIAKYAGLGEILNGAEEYISKIELTKDRGKLYAKIEEYGIF